MNKCESECKGKCESECKCECDNKCSCGCKCTCVNKCESDCKCTKDVDVTTCKITVASPACYNCLGFPIIADWDLKVSTMYGMLDQESHDPGNFDPKTHAPLPIRTVFILDPSRRVRLTLTYPASVGRSFTEILRVLDALQRSDEFKVASPAEWKQGEEMIVRFDIGEDEADKLFPNRRSFKPYLRFTSDPKSVQ